MPERTFQIPNMVGDEDFETVENALRQILGVAHVAMNAPVKEVTVRWDDPASWHDIRRTLTDLGYFPEGDDVDNVETDRR